MYEFLILALKVISCQQKKICHRITKLAASVTIKKGTN